MQRSLMDINCSAAAAFSRTVRGGLVLMFCFLASCAGSQGAGEPRDPFTAVTPDGPVVIKVKGSATGLTNSELTRLINGGVAEVYPIQYGAPPDVSANTAQMVWHVINDGRKPTAIVTVNIIEGGKIIRSKFANVAAPRVNPDAVFMYEISGLTHRVMTLASKIADQNGS